MEGQEHIGQTKWFAQKGNLMTKHSAMFWSGETLNERLDSLIDPFQSERVDCAAYMLAVGPEVYVSPNDQSVDPATASIRKLGKDEAFAVPPGQFAFLLTEEIVTVPMDALAFISIRAKTKFRGLVNVSGFHVDPGYCGQLTFAVFNAGPVPIHLKRGNPVFLIWYASLDRVTAFKKDAKIKRGIDPEIVTAISGELQSFASLTKRLNGIERQQTVIQFAATIILAIIVAVFAGLAIHVLV